MAVLIGATIPVWPFSLVPTSCSDGSVGNGMADAAAQASVVDGGRSEGDGAFAPAEPNQREQPEARRLKADAKGTEFADSSSSGLDSVSNGSDDGEVEESSQCSGVSGDSGDGIAKEAVVARTAEWRKNESPVFMQTRAVEVVGETALREPLGATARAAGGGRRERRWLTWRATVQQRVICRPVCWRA